jgi:hypothetical protein
MAQLSWQKPTDGSATLAIAQIRWQRTAGLRAGCLNLLAAIRPMPETRWQCLNFCGRTPAAGDRAGRGSRVPHHGGSTSPNASGAMAIPQDLWHRTLRMQGSRGQRNPHPNKTSFKPLMILQSASFCRFCHHQLPPSLYYTPMHQDDQGQPNSRSKIVLKNDGRQPWRSPSASPVGMTPAIRSRRLVLPMAPRSLMSAGLTTICRPWSRPASPPGAWVGDGDTALDFHDRDGAVPGLRRAVARLAALLAPRRGGNAVRPRANPSGTRY